MKDIVIYGAGGLGREVLWMIKNINKQKNTWNVLGFIVDYKESWGEEVAGFKVLGGSQWIEDYNKELFVTCAIGKSSVRKLIYEKVSQIEHVHLATLIDPTVRVDESVQVGEGSIICYNSIITVDINIGKGVLLNTGASVGHDASIGDYCTMFTNSMAAGNTLLEEGCEIGSGAFILQGIKVCSGTVVAPVSSVLNNITETGTYVGNPARRMR
ncbi:putative acetyltransferase EpsM [Ruminiclostridium hungatei]|uniref:Putative acetyltransferase EpsM n=1 Tax=Ruminiclostridium hungatei TaxID=48256 RepID=A0A1V4SJZ4_RUMHU|nr:acetyltransferase [Ruminiclostridium hungatei]OPX43567.1 putative acetyltransferase EpsM [Ruminiclostridium hungatei]